MASGKKNLQTEIEMDDVKQSLEKYVCLGLQFKSGKSDDLINFIRNEIGVVNVLENQNYWNLLEPKIVCKLMELIELDSYVWKAIYDWGKDYLKTRRMSMDIRTFFSEHDILKKLSLSHFESVESLTDFHKLTDKQLLDSDEILDYLRSNLMGPIEKRLPGGSHWVNVKKGEELTETISFRNRIVLICDDYEFDLYLTFYNNQLHKKWPEPIENAGNTVVNKIRFHFRGLGDRKEGTDDESDLNETDDESDSSEFSLDVFIKFEDDLKDCYRDGCFHHEPHSVPVLYAFGKKLSRELNSTDVGILLECLPYPIVQIKSVEIRYIFPADCRILKCSLTEDFGDCEKSYFTKNVIKIG